MPNLVRACLQLRIRLQVAGAVAVLGVMLLLASACGSGAEVPTQVPATPLPPVDYNPQSAALGAGLVEAYGCNACHSTDGTTLVGPTWQGLYGTQEELEDGNSVQVNDEYIRESIRAPDLKVVEGFTAGLMPATLGVKEEEIPHIIEYMKSLR